MKSNRHKKSPPAKKTVFILDDHPITRHGLFQLINQEPDLVVCGEAGSAREALTTIHSPLPDVILVDISLSGKSGFEFIRDVLALHPSAALLVLSMHDETVYAEHALRAGARGYVMKVQGGACVLAAIRRVLEGKIYVSDAMSAAIMDGFTRRRPRNDETALAILTDREFDVFQLLSEGLSMRQISERLGLSVPTIGTHQMHIKQKLKLTSGAELVRYAIRWAAAQQLIQPASRQGGE
jgi:DNA-binding NarL/FixJ family response regulator